MPWEEAQFLEQEQPLQQEEYTPQTSTARTKRTSTLMAPLTPLHWKRGGQSSVFVWTGMTHTMDDSHP